MKDWHSSVVSPGGEVSATAAAAWQRQAEVMVYGEELAGPALQSHVKPKLANRDPVVRICRFRFGLEKLHFDRKCLVQGSLHRTRQVAAASM
eukprot:6457759-Amphidinium_carterae.2